MPFSDEVRILFKQYCDLMKTLAYHRRRQDEPAYFKTWDKLLEMKRQFLETNGPGEHWD